jgi:hypothetical protein
MKSTVTVWRQVFVMAACLLLAGGSAARAQAQAAATRPGVYVVVYRTPAHVRYSKQEVFHGFAQDLWAWLRGKNVPIVIDPERGAIESESEMSVASMLNIARQLGATSLLFITVDRPITKWIKVTVRAYSLDGKLLWSEDASDSGSMTGKGGYEKTLKRIEAALEPRLGQEGLPVAREAAGPGESRP